MASIFIFNYCNVCSNYCTVSPRQHYFQRRLERTRNVCSSSWTVSCFEGDIGVCGIEVLDNFSCGISVTLILNCGIAVFSKSAGCGFLSFWMG